MKLFIFTCLVTIASAYYKDVNLNVDIDAIDNNVEEMMQNFACFLDKGPCTDTMMSYKKHISETFRNACADCSPLHKHIAEEFLKTATIKLPEQVKELKQKYDPEGKYFTSLMKELDKYDY